MITTQTQADKATARLAEIHDRQAAIAAERNSFTAKIGGALAGARLGKRDSGADAGRWALSRAALDTESADLAAEASALEAALAEWDADAPSRAMRDAQALLSAAAARGHELEERYADLFVRLVETVKGLRQAERDYRQAWQAITDRRGMPDPRLKCPLVPTDLRLLPENAWTDPAVHMERWRENRPRLVSPRRPEAVLPRLLTEAEAERAEGAARNRIGDGYPDDRPFTLIGEEPIRIAGSAA